MEGNFLLALFVLLASAVALAPLAKWAGLSTIIGYLAAGLTSEKVGEHTTSSPDDIDKQAKASSD